MVLALGLALLGGTDTEIGLDREFLDFPIQRLLPPTRAFTEPTCVSTCLPQVDHKFKATSTISDFSVHCPLLHFTITAESIQNACDVDAEMASSSHDNQAIKSTNNHHRSRWSSPTTPTSLPSALSLPFSKHSTMALVCFRPSFLNCSRRIERMLMIRSLQMMSPMPGLPVFPLAQSPTDKLWCCVSSSN